LNTFGAAADIFPCVLLAAFAFEMDFLSWRDNCLHFVDPGFQHLPWSLKAVAAAAEPSFIQTESNQFQASRLHCFYLSDDVVD
jgi:hypothetical protein